jgi:phage baseplate assembly protein W
MATYGIRFPFGDSLFGDFLRMTKSPEEEVRVNLLHLILTTKGSRYFKPDFGTRIYYFIFDPNDTLTHNDIEDDIRNAVKKYIPNLTITNITILTGDALLENNVKIKDDENYNLYRTSSKSTSEYTAKITITYTINSGTFSTSDFIIINI